MKLNFTICVFLLSFWGFSQNEGKQKSYCQIPIEYQSHPELGKTTHSATITNEIAYELIHERTKFSRTFLNTNTTKTTVHSSVPLHYRGGDGKWYSIDYKLMPNNDKLAYPAQNPFFELGSGHTALLFDNQKVKITEKSKFIFLAADGAVLKTLRSESRRAEQKSDSEILLKDVAPNIDRNITLYNDVFKYDYSINQPFVLPRNLGSLVIEETIELPKGFAMQQNGNRLAIVNAAGLEVSAFHQPIISDSKSPVRNLRAEPLEAKYNLIKQKGGNYTIQIQIDGSWLTSSERVFPIHIDPVVTVSNTDVINSCFTPTYQQAPLQVAVPAGQTVLSTNISYDFVAVAGSGAWMSDQRSFVSGPNGQTPVASGVGSTAGLYTYNITNSPIGNIVSTGQIQYVFNIGRNWGGSGCDAAFNFVNRREVTVTYGTIEFGNGPLLINEYSASNRNFNDGFGRTEDWIELYNASPDTYLNLAGYYLSNNVDNPTKWQIQSGVIPPASRVLVFCSNRNISSGTVFHAGFDLTQTNTEPDEVVVADPSGTIIDSHVMFRTQTNHSYGRTTDGASTWSVFSTPTPGAANTNGFVDYSTKPVLSVAPGMYPGTQSVAMSTTGLNEQIRYTTNGSTPTAASTLYTGPVPVTASTVIRARTFSTSPNILPGFIETNSYFINENSSLPIVSLAGDANLISLLNGTTIEPTGNFEYFENNVFVDETVGDFDRHGNDSWAYNQRGIDFVARDDHGYKRRLQHKFFDTSDRTNFRRLILKAAGSDNFPGQDGGAHIRDVFAQKLSEVAGLELDERRSKFVSLFVNGQYWGVYDLREKVDDNQYTDYYYGQDYIFRDSDNYIQYIKTWGSTNPEFGNQPAITAWNDLTSFVQNNDMSVAANFDYVDSQLNIDSLIDYFVLNSYLVNKDWLNWNTSWWRGLDPSGGALKWRYALWDMDGILGHYINYTGIPDISANAAPCNVEELEVGVGHTQTIGKLIEENPSVRQRYVARYADLLNTHLSCDQVTALYDSIVATIAPEMPRQVARWGGSLAQWQANVQAGRDFLLTRCSQTIATGLVECYEVTGPYATTFNVLPVNTGQIKMNSEWLQTYPYTAQIFGNIDTLVEAGPADGWEFSSWLVNGVSISPADVFNPNLALQIEQAASITAIFKETPPSSEEALYYWHFNTLDTPLDVLSIPADYSLIAGADPLMTYTGTGPRDIDANNNGSTLNLHFNEPAGKCARVRNPSAGRSLVFDLPTTGYKDIKFAYAVQRTNEGQLINNIAYSIDGTNFIQTGLSQSAFNISTDFTVVQVDFSAITGVRNNPNFKIQITFEGNNATDNGNNRFDNISLMGVLDDLSVPNHNVGSYQVFPNPFTDNVQIISTEQMGELAVFDLLGKKVLEKTVDNSNNETIDLATLSAGMYILKIKTPNGQIAHKLVKR